MATTVVQASSSSSPSPSPPPSSPLPASLLFTLNSVHDTLLTLQTDADVARVLYDLAQDIQHTQQTRQIESAHTEQQQLEQEYKQQQEQWEQQTQQLQQDLQHLTKQTDQLLHQRQEISHILTQRQTEVEAAQKEDQRSLSALLHLSSAQDVSLLPRSVLVQLVELLRPVDLAHCASVCQRWNRDLDTGKTWKVLTVQLIHNILLTRAEERQFKQRTSGDHSTSTNPSFHLTFSSSQLLPKPPKGILNKTDIFKYSTALYQKTVDSTMKEFESYSSTAGIENEKKNKARSDLEVLRDAVGRRRVMLGMLAEKIATVGKRRAAMVKDVSRLEQEIAAEKNTRNTLRNEYTEKTKVIEKTLKELRELAQTQLQMKRQTESIKAQKIMLVKDIAQLQQDTQEANRERDEYDRKLQELRERIKQVAL